MKEFLARLLRRLAVWIEPTDLQLDLAESFLLFDNWLR